MTNLNLNGSLLFGSPETDSIVEWVPKVLAVGGLIITERDGELIIRAKPQHWPENGPPELPPLPVSPLLVLLVAAMLWPGTACPQGVFPTKPVKFLVPYPAGGTNDVLARIVSDKLQAKWGQPIVIENRAPDN